MFTIFHVLPLAGFGFGLFAGMALAAEIPGVRGNPAIFLTILGGCAGFVIGRLPFLIGLRAIQRRFAGMTADELRGWLRESGCAYPNLVLLELQSRGEDIERELPLAVDMLTSENRGRRPLGWAALTSAFPQVAEKVRNYRLEDSVEECQRKLAAIRHD
jgi:hypothetical protein